MNTCPGQGYRATLKYSGTCPLSNAASKTILWNRDNVFCQMTYYLNRSCLNDVLVGGAYVH